MHTVIENAGAQRGVFILEKQGKWVIEAEGNLNQGSVHLLQSLTLSGHVSMMVINYVIRTQKPVVLEAATKENMYREDEYIRTHQIKSLLCMPILSRQKLVGIVYLENHLTESAFTPNRIEVLTLLSAQIATSLENALFVKDLEIARQQAEIANQAKTAFLANMSHEFKTPLNAILGYVQLFNREANLPMATIHTGCQVIQQNSEYLLTLINDIIDISTIESGKMELHPVNTRFDHFLNTLSQIFENRARTKGLAFYRQFSPQLPVGIFVDERRLRQVITHLLSNAIKFTQQGHITFTVIPAGDNIRFQVEDSGIGITSTDLEKIFLPFEQASAWKQKSEGAGLGLSFAKKLTEMMHGTLEVSSQVGQGSCFWVDLPLVESTEWVGEKLDIQENTPEVVVQPMFSTEQEIISAIRLLSHKQIQVLFDLSMNGDVNGLIQQAKKLEQFNAQLKPLTEKIFQTTKVYDTDTISDLLEPYLG